MYPVGLSAQSGPYLSLGASLTEPPMLTLHKRARLVSTAVRSSFVRYDPVLSHLSSRAVCCPALAHD